MYEALLNSAPLQTDWHLAYGLTERRKDALVEDKGHPDSFFNGNSETALTLFMLGRLDEWKQCADPQTRSRTGGGWDRNFFDSLRGDDATPSCDALRSTPLRRYLASLLGSSNDAYSKAVMMFELEVRNRGFYGGTTPPTLSFLNISQKWSEFDAVVMVPPPIRLFIFIESKLGADVSRKTRYFPFVSQIVRNLEAAFFLCQPTSLYRKWDFRYIVLCPKKDYEYRSTYYSCVLHNIRDHLALYRQILSKEYKAQASEDRINQLFAEFQDTVPNKVRPLHWSSLWELLEHDGFVLARYEAALRAAFGADADLAILASRNRLALAGISLPQAS